MWLTTVIVHVGRKMVPEFDSVLYWFTAGLLNMAVIFGIKRFE